MYSRVYKHLNENILFNKQFGFQKAHSIEQAIVQLVDKINSSFDKCLFTYVFITLFGVLC